MASNNPSILGSLPPPPPPSSGSLRVRARITLDDDSSSSEFEYNSEEEVWTLRKKTGSVASTTSSLEEDVSDNEEFEGGREEGFETEPERHFEGDPDGGTRERSGLGDKGKDFRPIVGGGHNEERVGKPISLAVVEGLRPIARMSIEEDEFHELVGDVDEGGVSEEEDVQIPGSVVKVPSFGVIVAPRVRLVSADEEDDEEVFEEDELLVHEDYSLVNQSKSVGFPGEPVTVKMSEELVKPSAEDVKHVMVETIEKNEDTKHAIEDSVLDENVKLAATEVVQAREPQLQECTVENGGVKELMDCSSNEVFTVGTDKASDVAETAEVVQAREPQLQECTVENGGVKELMDCSSNEVFTVGTDKVSDVAEIADQQQKNLLSDKDREELIDEVSARTDHLTAEMERLSSSSSNLEGERLADLMATVDGQTSLDTDELENNNEDHEGGAMFDKSTVEALLEAETAKSISTSLKVVETVNDSLSKEDKETMKTIQLIRVKFLRVVHRLGLHSEDFLVAQVLNRLALAVGGHTSDEFNFGSAENMAVELEAKGKADLDFSLNILVLGKTGVGKSATINSIFGEKKVTISPFGPGTNRVNEISGIVNGVKIRVLDTPGLRSSVKEGAINHKILASIKGFAAKFPPDIVLYVDRLDNQATDLVDLPLLKSLSHYLTANVWQNAVITLTHGASPLPDGPTGSPLRFELLAAQRSHAIQRAISQAVGDPQLASMMHPVSVVENNTSGMKDENGEVLLPNGQSWRTQLLLLCYSLKILSEATSAKNPHDTHGQTKYFGFRRRSLSLPHIVSMLLQSRHHPKLASDQGGRHIDSDIEMVDLSDSDEEGDNDYDQLLPFKPLRKSQVESLSKEQRKAYFEEYDYRAKLFQKKQRKEEVRRLKEKRDIAEDEVQEDGSATSTPVLMPDLVLPPSFDGAEPSFRYRGLEPTSRLLTRPVLDPQGWDHDCGYDGVSVESNLAIAGRFPCAFALQVTKDKEEFNIHLDSSVCTKHWGSGSSMAGFDIQTVGEQLAYVVRGETKSRNFKINSTSTGVSITLLGESIATGLKIEDQLVLGKRLILVGSGGAVRSGADTAYGAAFEVRLRSKDFPVDQDQSTLGLSLMNWQGGLGVMATLHSQVSVGRGSKVAINVGMNGRRSGQITLKTTSSDLHIALISVLPVILSIFRNTCLGSISDN